jgi:F0F1-type ATP synthase assembly protein I
MTPICLAMSPRFEKPPPEKVPTSSPEETARRSGLAFSAGIVFFSSVVFMLFLGWIADWLMGSSPWAWSAASCSDPSLG